jgi:hypothetical protein
VDGCCVDDDFVGEGSGFGYCVDEGLESFIVADLVKWLDDVSLYLSSGDWGVRR